MPEMVLSDASRAALIDHLTSRIRNITSWDQVQAALDAGVRDVLEIVGHLPARVVDDWRPVAARPTPHKRRLEAAAKVDLQARAVAAVRRAESWERLGSALARAFQSAAKAYGAL